MIAGAIILGGTALVSSYMQSEASKKAASTAAAGADAATQAQLEMYYQGREDLAPWRETGGWALNNLRNLIQAGPGALVYPTPYGSVPAQVTPAGIQSGEWALPPGAIQEGDKWGFPTSTPTRLEYQDGVPVPGGYVSGPPSEWYDVGTYPEGYTGPRPQVSRASTEAAPAAAQGTSTPYGTDWASRFPGSPYYNFLLGEGVKARERGAAAGGMLKSGAEQKALAAWGQNLASTEYQNWLNQWYQSLTPWQSLAGLGQTSAAQTANLGAQTGANVGQTTMAGAQAQAAGYLGQGNIWGNLFNQLGTLGAMYSMGYGGGGYQNPYMNQLAANRAALNMQTGGKYAYGL